MYWVVVFWIWLQTASSSFPNQTSGSRFKPRILKGWNVEIHQFSYATLLYFENTRPSSCGASLIMVQAVLTSAHCVDELRYKRGQIHAYFGATVPKESKVVRRVIDYTTHPRYNEVTGNNNLAVAFLENRVPLINEIKKVPLAAEEPSIGTKAVSVGWGKQQLGKLPDFSRWRRLKATRQKIISGKDCAKISGLTISPKGLCAMSVIGHFYKDDSGNGLVLTKPFPMLVGVLSFVANGISVFSNVFSNRDWIIKTCYSLFKKNCDGKNI